MTPTKRWDTIVHPEIKRELIGTNVMDGVEDIDNA